MKAAVCWQVAGREPLEQEATSRYQRDRRTRHESSIASSVGQRRAPSRRRGSLCSVIARHSPYVRRPGRKEDPHARRSALPPSALLPDNLWSRRLLSEVPRVPKSWSRPSTRTSAWPESACEVCIAEFRCEAARMNLQNGAVCTVLPPHDRRSQSTHAAPPTWRVSYKISLRLFLCSVGATGHG
jgi:hypothetical protein